jgi:predicted MFS family arabinose efflux permease
MFLGDLLGPMLGEGSRLLGASSPLAIIAVLILPLLIAAVTVRLPDPPSKAILPPEAAGGIRSKGFVSLFLVALVAGAGLATLHVLLLLSEQPGGLTRQAVSLTLSGCGVGMLAAQLVYSRGRRLARHARGIIRPTLLVLVGSIVAAAYLDNTLLLSIAVFLAGWTAATLRLVTSYLVSRIDRHRMGFWLGLNQSATSLGQTAAPLAIAGVGVAGQEMVLIVLAAGALILVVIPGRLTSVSRQKQEAKGMGPV